MTKARYMVIIVFVGWRENYFKMLLWLSRQSTSLVRTRSPVRIWLTAPCNPNTLDAMRKNRMASVFSKDFEDKILYCKRRKREGTRPNFFTFPYISFLDCLLFSFFFGYPRSLSCFYKKRLVQSFDCTSPFSVRLFGCGGTTFVICIPPNPPRGCGDMTSCPGPTR